MRAADVLREALMMRDVHGASEMPADRYEAVRGILAERAQIYDQLSRFQALSTSQLTTARACAFEAAALECEKLAGTVPENEQAQICCRWCAEAIRELANR